MLQRGGQPLFRHRVHGSGARCGRTTSRISTTRRRSKTPRACILDQGIAARSIKELKADLDTLKGAGEPRTRRTPSNYLLVVGLPASDTSDSPHTQSDDIEVGGQRGRETLARPAHNVVGRIESSRGGRPAPKRGSRSSVGGYSSRSPTRPGSRTVRIFLPTELRWEIETSREPLGFRQRAPPKRAPLRSGRGGFKGDKL